MPASWSTRRWLSATDASRSSISRRRGTSRWRPRTARLWVTYNGEIYNYVELADELRGLGRRFRTGTDTEVLLQAYDEWGEEAFGRLNGDFAFAIWDREPRGSPVCATGSA